MKELYRDRYWVIEKPAYYTGSVSFIISHVIHIEFHKIYNVLGEMNSPSLPIGWTLVVNNKGTLFECTGRQGTHIHIMPSVLQENRCDWMIRRWKIANTCSLSPSFVDSIQIMLGCITEKERLWRLH